MQYFGLDHAHHQSCTQIQEDTNEEDKNYSKESGPIKDTIEGNQQPSSQEEITPAKNNSKSLFGGLLAGLKQDDEMEDGEGPPKENWEFCVFQMKKK